MEQDLSDYEQAMADVLAELGVEPSPVTVRDLELADKALLVARVAHRQEAAGRAWAEVFGAALEAADGEWPSPAGSS